MANVFEALFTLALDEDEGYIVESVVEDIEIASKKIKKLLKNGGLSEKMKAFVTTACEH